jgi:ERCC4-type nuclease
MENGFSLVVDSREPPTIHRLFEKEYPTNYQKKELPIGDIFIPERGLLFERKEYSDLVSSVFQKHLEKQQMELENTGLHTFIVVVGTIEDYQMGRRFGRKGSISWTQEHHWGLILSSMRKYPHTHWLFPKNNNQFLTLIKKAILKYDGDITKSIDMTELMTLSKLDANDKESIQARCLSGVPDIGPTLARKILKQAGPLRHLIAMDITELEKIDGVGPHRAKNIFDAFI